MSLVTRNHHQAITVWAATPDENGGFTFAEPVLTKGRWEDRREAFIEPSGSEAVSRAIVYLEVDARVDDYVYLGDGSNVDDPTTLNGALPIRSFVKTPSLRSLQSERKAIL